MQMIRSETVEGFSKVFSFARPYWKLGLIALLFMLIYTGAMGARLALVKPIIDKLTAGSVHSKHHQVDPQKGNSRVEWQQRLKEGLSNTPYAKAIMEWVKIQTSSYKGIGLLAIVLTPIVFISSYFYNYLLQRIIWRVNVDISNFICDKLIYQPVGFFEKRKSGELISRVLNDSKNVQQVMSSYDILIEPLKLFAGLILALYFSWKLFLFCLLMLPFPIVLATYFGKRVKKYGRESLVRLGRLTEALREILGGIRVIKSYGMEEDKSREFRERNNEWARQKIKTSRTVILYDSITEALYTFGMGIAIIAGGYAITSSNLSLGELGGFAAAGILVLQSAKALSKRYTKLQEPLAAVSRILEFLNSLTVVEDPPGALTVTEFKKEIAFRNVSFTYESQPVLKDVSFTARKGECVAIVGESGVGKTTLLHLLPRFYEPTGGAIEIDGQDIRNIKRACLLELVSIVTQQAFLFNRSIAENIGYGKKGARREEIKEAAKAANIHDFISGLSRGYNTEIGELGVKLSAGQRQRIAIARALLKNAPILILDEATNALDSESEKLVLEPLNQLMTGKTTFVVAHRLSSLKYCNKIIVLKSGELAEMGTHDELIAKEGEYWRLYQEQIGNKEGLSGQSLAKAL